MEEPSKKSRAAALAFVFFLGPWGAHRFYAGRTGSAIAQLVLTLTIVGAVVSGVWAFVDLIMVAAGKFKDRNGDLISVW